MKLEILLIERRMVVYFSLQTFGYLIFGRDSRTLLNLVVQIHFRTSK